MNETISAASVPENIPADFTADAGTEGVRTVSASASVPGDTGTDTASCSAPAYYANAVSASAVSKTTGHIIKKKFVITTCGCDFIMPFALVYLFYIILHGHLSPGGGFQGGVLMVAVFTLIYLGYGYDGLRETLYANKLHDAEGWASIVYILIAMLGVVFAGNFCQNILFGSGNIGDLWSSGTIFLMNAAVGFKVLTGVGVLALSMLAILNTTDKDYK